MAATISSVPASDLRCTNLLHFWQVTDSSCSLRATPTIFSAFCNRPLLCHLWWSLFAQVFEGFWDRLFPEFFLHKIKLLKRGLWVVLQCWWPIGPFIFYWSVFSWKRVTWDYSTSTGVWKPLRRKNQAIPMVSESHGSCFDKSFRFKLLITPAFQSQLCINLAQCV